MSVGIFDLWTRKSQLIELHLLQDLCSEMSAWLRQERRGLERLGIHVSKFEAELDDMHGNIWDATVALQRGASPLIFRAPIRKISPNVQANWIHLRDARAIVLLFNQQRRMSSSDI